MCCFERSANNILQPESDVNDAVDGANADVAEVAQMVYSGLLFRDHFIHFG